MKARLLLNKQLLGELAVRSRQLNECLSRARFKLAMNRAKPINKSMAITFPKDAFTMEELEAANPALSREDVKMHLVYLISLRQVEFFPRIQTEKFTAPAIGNGKPFPLLYRITPDFYPKVRTAQDQCQL